MKAIVGSLLITFFPLMCKNGSDNTTSDEVQHSSVVTMPAKEKAEESDVVDDANFLIEQKIIRDANLRFETDDLNKSYQQIQAAVKKYSGIIQEDTEGKDYQSVFRNVTVRIPSSNFDNFISDAGKDVAYFDNKQISARDVTTEFIDIEARLRAKRTLENRYFELLKKATKVSEIIEIEKQLAAIREEIDAKEGQLKYLQRQVSMSTVVIEFYKKTATSSGATVSYGSKMWNAIKSGFNGISSFFIGLLYIWPFIVILVVLIFVMRRKLKRKKIV